MERNEVYLRAKENLEAYALKHCIKRNRLEEVYYKPKDYNIIRNELKKANILIEDKSGNLDYPVLFYLFCGHLADRRYMRNIIMFYNKGSDTRKILSEVLFGFDPHKVVKYNNKDEIIQKVKSINSQKIQNENKWNEYIKGIYQCAKFLTDGKIGSFPLSFNYLLSEPTDTDSLRIYLYSIRPLINNLSGVGAAVCYNWLKECGATWLAKPDMHIKRVVAKLLLNIMNSNDYDVITMEDKIIDDYLATYPDLKKFPYNKSINSTCRLTRDEFVAIYMYEWAKEVNTTAYQLDRILYLYCTNGYFYMEDNEDSLITENDLLAMIDSEI